MVIESLLDGARRARGTTVVIDVLRAFTSACVALSGGASRIVMTALPEEALALRDRGEADVCIGEVGGRMPAGFDHGNSPHEIASADLRGAAVAQSTRAGTTGVAAAAAAGAERIYCAALVNASATARAVAAARPAHVTLVAMGAWGTERSDEDELCALYLRNLICGRHPDPAAVGELARSGGEAGKYRDPAQDQYHPRDLEMALSVDSHDAAIEVRREGGLLVARPVPPGGRR